VIGRPPAQQIMAVTRTKRLARGVGRYVNYAYQGYQAFQRAKQSIAARRRNGSGTQMAKKGFNPGPITGENDWRNTYRRKRMPRRRRRRWVSFSRKVKHIITKQVAPQFNVYTRQIQVLSPAGGQNSTEIHTVLGGFGGGGSTGTQDISQLFSRALALASTTGVTPLVANLRIHITGWMIETSIANTGGNTAYIDCYYWRTKADCPTTTANSVRALWTESLVNVAVNAPIVPGTTALSIDDYGVTPFQGTQFAKTCQIWKKTRVKVAPGGTLQLEQRSGRNYYRTGTYDEHYSLLRRCTEGIFFVQYGFPTGVATAPDGTATATTVNYSTNVNYTWRIVADNRMTGAHTDTT